MAGLSEQMSGLFGYHHHFLFYSHHGISDVMKSVDYDALIHALFTSGSGTTTEDPLAEAMINKGLPLPD